MPRLLERYRVGPSRAARACSGRVPATGRSPSWLVAHDRTLGRLQTGDTLDPRLDPVPGPLAGPGHGAAAAARHRHRHQQRLDRAPRPDRRPPIPADGRRRGGDRPDPARPRPAAGRPAEGRPPRQPDVVDRAVPRRGPTGDRRRLGRARQPVRPSRRRTRSRRLRGPSAPTSTGPICNGTVDVAPRAGGRWVATSRSDRATTAAAAPTTRPSPTAGDRRALPAAASPSSCQLAAPPPRPIRAAADGSPTAEAGYDRPDVRPRPPDGGPPPPLPRPPALAPAPLARGRRRSRAGSPRGSRPRHPVDRPLVEAAALLHDVDKALPRTIRRPRSPTATAAPTG